MIGVILAAQGRLLIAAIGIASGPPQALLAAVIAAVRLTTIVRSAEIEDAAAPTAVHLANRFDIARQHGSCELDLGPRLCDTSRTDFDGPFLSVHSPRGGRRQPSPSFPFTPTIRPTAAYVTFSASGPGYR
jgi:hypothetical protein